MPLSGHLWTVAHKLRNAGIAPESAPWSLEVADPLRDRVRLTGLLRREPEARALVVVIHGIGGCAEAPYTLPAAAAASAAGMACLRLNLRGCDRRGEDFYHAGLISDLDRVLASPEAVAYDEIYLLGYSIGGHLALAYAAAQPDPRLTAVAAVCSPLELAPCAANIDRPALWPYRRYVLTNLKQIYGAVAAQREVTLPFEEARKITSLVAWDDVVIAPRWGFEGAADYYAQVSVGGRLDRLAVPALLVAAEHDPMVPAALLRTTLARPAPALEVRWIERGGHVGFPADLDLGLAAPPGLESQIVGWLENR